MSAYAINPNWLESTDCASCGVEFASSVVAKRREDGQTLYCPNGHSLTFGESRNDILRKQLAAKKAELKRTRESLEWQRSQRATAEKRRIAQKAQTTKARNQLKRVKNGVCPCCNRTFQNLLRHMGTQHPDYEGTK